jgi:hypothetical protein
MIGMEILGTRDGIENGSAYAFGMHGEEMVFGYSIMDSQNG